MKFLIKLIFTILLPLLFLKSLMAQEKSSIAVLDLDITGILSKKEAIRKMEQLHLEETGQFDVMDKYDLADASRAKTSK